MPIANNGKGSPTRMSACQTALQRLMTKVAASGVVCFTFHDLKAGGVNDFEGDKQKAGWHKSPRWVAIYSRKLIEIEPNKIIFIDKT